MDKLNQDMRVVFDNIIFTLQRTGGISVVWQELLKRAVYDESYSSLVLDYPSENLCRKELAIDDARCHYLPIRHGERYRTPDYKPDGKVLFHSSYFRVLPFPNVRNITTIHDLTYHYYRGFLPRTVHVIQEEYALRHSAGVICVSDNTKHDLLSLYPWLNEDAIRVIHNGVSSCFYPIPNTQKEDFLLYVGNRAASYKHFDIAVEVARMAHRKIVIVGSPLTAKESLYLNRTLGEEMYSAIGNVSNSQLNAYYNRALCLLYPSDYEGFGIPIIEAQRAGCPVLCQEVSSIPEVTGGTALSVQHQSPDKVARQMADIVGELYQGRIGKQQIQAGFENAKRFSWDKNYQETIDFYKDIYK